jgi:hypothetical protein
MENFHRVNACRIIPAEFLAFNSCSISYNGFHPILQKVLEGDGVAPSEARQGPDRGSRALFWHEA